MRFFILSGLVFISSFFIFHIEGKAQSKIILSNKTEVVDGQTFYIHKVEKGQTLYSLTKAYHITEADILKYNTTAKDGLQIGQILKIPKLENTVDLSDTVPPSEFGFIFHQVKAGETLYRIMKQYKINLKSLKDYNPDLSSNLQIG